MAIVIGGMTTISVRNGIPEKNGNSQFNINIDVYLAQLDRLHEVINVKRPCKKNQVVFIMITRVPVSSVE